MGKYCCCLPPSSSTARGVAMKKLAYVAALLHEKGIVFDPENLKDEIRAMIEAAVRTLGDDEVKAMV